MVRHLTFSLNVLFFVWHQESHIKREAEGYQTWRVKHDEDYKKNLHKLLSFLFIIKTQVQCFKILYDNNVNSKWNGFWQIHTFGMCINTC